MVKNILVIETEKIIPNPHQPRREFDDNSITELANSIAEVGLLQPLVVRKVNDKFELIAGERRLRASKLIGLNKVPVMLFDVNDLGSTALALIENIQREQLNYFDEAICYRRLLENHSLTQQQVAKLIGKSQSAVANKLRLLKHSDKIISRMRLNSFSERHSRALLNLIDENEKNSIIDIIIDKNLNVRDTEKLVDMRNTSIKKKRQNVRGVIKNYRMYINTIKNAYEEISKYGIKSHFDLTEDDNEYTIIIKIEK